MASGAFIPLDEAARHAAIDPQQSFTVRAPAGSGKTELLLQRFLALLPTVDRPESIVAITFTRKAAGEMRERVMRALSDARRGEPVEKDHERVTRELALAALQQDARCGWHLLDHPGRLRIQTIDSLCLSIAAEMPFLSRLGEMPAIEDDTRVHYNEAARLTLLEPAPEFRPALEALLAHFDNSAAMARQMITEMLKRRDQWSGLAFGDAARERSDLQHAFSALAEENMQRFDALVPQSLKLKWAAAAGLVHWPAISASKLQQWRVLPETVLVKDCKGWRKRQPFTGLEQTEELRLAMKEVNYLPPAQYDDTQWTKLEAFLEVLRMALVQLQMVFRDRGTIDFCELNLAAHRALESAGNPTVLAEKMDWRIRHFLIDEFQDTSRSQFDLLQKLTADWQTDDGRTLFLVGDPMQSVYRFRQAEVGLFLEVERSGLGHLRPRSLTLTTNYRSPQALVDHFNAIGTRCFPEVSDAALGAIEYVPSNASDTESAVEFTFDGYDHYDTGGEAERVIQLIKAAQKAEPKGSVGILVRARPHLTAITKALRQAELPYRAVELDPLDQRPVVRDLLALTRAMLHFEDRISWLAILRAPWCGLTLADLLALTGEPDPTTRRWRNNIWQCLQSLSGLSQDGQRRAGHLRDVLSAAFAQHGRWPLRRWVERVWINLGGPACLDSASDDLADASAFFDLLEKEQAGADPRDFDQLSERASQLFAQSNPAGDPLLQVMTIHKAKGLQFHTVILPGLSGGTRPDDPPLIHFDERISHDGSRQLLLAARNETVGAKDLHYEFLAHLERQKSRNEKARLLYVAITRAKRRLHMTARLRRGKDGYKPTPDSLLAGGLFEYLTELGMAQVHPRAGQTVLAFAAPPPLKRLSANWAMPPVPASVTFAGCEERPVPEPHEPTFEWVGESLRYTGIVVHRLLERMPGQMPADEDIRAALAHAGISPYDLRDAAVNVQKALEKTLASARGQWIFSRQHASAHKEYAVSGVVDGEIVGGRVDRTFVDENDVRWIVDFKTSVHQGGDLEEFLDEQQRRYGGQMNRYARIFSKLGKPVRLGLYFPLLDAWREWAP